MKSWKNFAFAVALTALITSCSSYKFVTESSIVYLEEGQDVTSVFTSYDVDIIRLQFTTITPRFYYNRPYYYDWYTRPLWLDYNFIYDPWHFGYYSFFYRPWNWWDYWMRPWHWNRPWRDSMLDGPFNNQGYNIVYNNSRRKPRTIETAIVSNRVKPRIKPTVIIPRIKPKPNYSKPIQRYKPSNSKPNYSSKPNYNFKPNYSTKPSSKPSSNTNIKKKSKRNEKN